MKTQYFTATSLDGFIATEDDPLEWLFPLGDINDSSYPEFISKVGALAMGSATYEWMLRNAEKVAAETGSPWPYTQPAWVFSNRTLPAIEGANLRFVQGDVRQVHNQMRAAAGTKNIWIVGGGKPLFPRRVLSPRLQLVSVRQIGSGMAELRYEIRRVGNNNA
jgi:dihydrofolate reductase